MSAMEMFWAAPPISRTLATSAFFLSIAVYTRLLPAHLVIFHQDYLWNLRPQLWRLFTAFHITSKDLGIIFDTYFLYQYGSKLESASPRFSQPGDFFTYVVFVCVTILGLNVLVAGGVIFTSALVLALAYTSTQDDRGQKATFFIVTIPAQWIPYAMLLMTLIMNGPDASKIQATGLIAAHLHDFLTRLWPTFGGGRNLIATPAFVKKFFEKKEPIVNKRSYGTAFVPAAKSESASASGLASSGSVLPESWRNRGSGHRLGGD